MNFAIVGATGNVGRKTIDILEKSKLKIDKLFLVASKRSAGKKIKFKNRAHFNTDYTKRSSRPFFFYFSCNRKFY